MRVVMEQPLWKYGSQEGFDSFCASLTNGTKLIAVSHTDVDGIGSAKIVDAALQADAVYLMDYTEVNDVLVERLRNEAPSHIVISDLGLKRDFVEKLSTFARVLVIDHHQASEDLNAERVAFMNAQGFCATYLAYFLLHDFKDISSWEWLVACACIADVATNSVQGFMVAQFQKEGLAFSNGVKQGTFWELVTGINNALIYYAEDRMQVYRALTSDFVMPALLIEPSRLIETDIQDCIVRFNQGKEDINGRWYWEFVSKYRVKSTAVTMISFLNPTRTCLIVNIDGDVASVSARCQDRHEDMNLLLKKLVEGFPNADAGGHIPAAGGHFPVDRLSEFKKRLENV